MDRIQEAILESAQAEAARIIRAAEMQVEEWKAAQLEEAKEEAEQQYRMRTRAIEEGLARQVTQSRGASGKQLLERRNAVLNSVFDKARTAILALPSSEYGKSMRRWLESCLEDASGKVRVHPSEAALFSAMLQEMNKSRSASAQLAMDEAHPLPERGGFIFVGEGFEVDQTLDKVLEGVRHELSPSIAASLFTE